MSGYATCPACDGSGVVFDYINEWGKAEDKDCGLCGGSGEVRADVAVDFLEQKVAAE